MRNLEVGLLRVAELLHRVVEEEVRLLILCCLHLIRVMV